MDRPVTSEQVIAGLAVDDDLHGAEADEGETPPQEPLGEQSRAAMKRSDRHDPLLPRPSERTITASMLVRAARAKDLPAVSRLAADLVRLHHRLDPPRFMLVEPIEEGYQWFLSREIKRKGALILVAEDEGTIIGYAYATLEPRNWNDLLDACGKLNDVYVDPAARRKGAGRALVKETLAQLRARGAPRVVLLTAWKNPDAHAFFESLGYRRTMLEMTTEL